MAKQLAGAPSEFAAMAEPQPVDGAIQSHSALIPITLTPARSGGAQWTARLPLDAGQDLASVMLISGNADWQLTLDSSDGQMRAAQAMAVEHGPAQLGIGEAQVAGTRFAFAQSGERQFAVRSSDTQQSRGFLLLEGSEQAKLTSYQYARNQRVGERISILARLSDAYSVQAASLEVTDPAGSVSQVRMADDGLNNDGAAGDGLYGASFAANQSGDFQAQVLVYGANTAGESIVRTAEHLIPVVNNSIVDDLNGLIRRGGTVAPGADAGRIEFTVPLQSKVPGQHYRAYAQVWGKSARGADVPVAWIGGMVVPNNGAIKLSLDTRWLSLANVSGNLALRELRIEDPDNFIPLLTAKSVSLQGQVTAPSIAAKSIAIDEAMTMGPRPASLANRGVGTRLLLVHGYCSGSVWPSANFTNASTFLDANQNRSHDQFAQLIRSFGNTWNSYGIVAHSQGGAAALHLYNYYWSGLDNATGARLIQSVGTPYRGTNLAGVLAALGGIFGVGCGTQNDLTYSGASSWLAGISTASRGKVNYYTTSFRLTNWWTNDYCNFASDLVLSDPEDGTTEQANGQLSGGVNRGHVTGQCHTDGMRDPAQYRDAGRNATMNSNAAR